MSSEDDESDVATTAFDEKEMLVKEDPIAHDDEEQVPQAYNVIVSSDEMATKDGVAASIVCASMKKETSANIIQEERHYSRKSIHHCWHFRTSSTSNPIRKCHPCPHQRKPRQRHQTRRRRPQ